MHYSLLFPTVWGAWRFLLPASLSKCRLCWFVTVSFASLVLWPCAMPVHASALRYKIVDLGVPEGFYCGSITGSVSNGVIAKSVNDKGHVTGYFNTSYYNRHGFMYDGSVKDIGYVVDDYGQEIFEPVGINDSDVIVGAYAFNTSDRGAPLYAAGNFTFIKQSIVCNGETSPAVFDPVGINNSGQVVGNAYYCYKAEGASAGNVLTRGALYTDATLTYVGPAIGSRAFSVNDQGSVVGQALDGTGSFVYADGTNTVAYPSNSATAKAISNNGYVVGTFSDPDLTSHAFLNKNGELSVIPLSSAYPNKTVSPQSVNASGVVALILMGDGADIAGVYDGEKTYALSELVAGENPFSSLSSAVSISDTGYITGVGYSSSDGNYVHSYLAIPVVNKAIPQVLDLLLLSQ
ncbi:hypothetical protein [Solidesulfovibrio alcoholivorans]|uniref:hypothetical protein n=1 Tax=Solidesulfovibrio alcoholivorans TaxID=81406 RepID=UPI000A02A401|nr:hypothetical protein [Solidesulfovibrio alcoholivorans]